MLKRIVAYFSVQNKLDFFYSKCDNFVKLGVLQDSLKRKPIQRVIVISAA